MGLSRETAFALSTYLQELANFSCRQHEFIEGIFLKNILKFWQKRRGLVEFNESVEIDVRIFVCGFFLKQVQWYRLGILK